MSERLRTHAHATAVVYAVAMFASLMHAQIVNMALPELQGASHLLAERGPRPDNLAAPRASRITPVRHDHGPRGPRRPHIDQFGAQ